MVTMHGRALSLLLWLAAGPVWADVPPARPWTERDIVSVTVVATGLGDDRRDARQDEPCSTFAPRAADVRAYLGRAKVLTQQQYVHDTVWTACHATGTLRLRDGREGEWAVRRGGAGAVRIGSTSHYFDCQPCRRRLERPPAGRP